MLAFVVVAAKPGRVIRPEMARRVADDRPDLSFEPTDDATWRNANGTVVVRCWQRPSPGLGIGSARSALHGGFTAFAGHLWPRRGGWAAGAPPADQLAELISRGRVAEHLEDLRGVYSVVTLDAEGNGWAASDPVGMGLLHVGETADVTVLSTRSQVAAWAMTADGVRAGRDATAAAWLAYTGDLLGDRTGFAGVRTLALGRYVEIGPTIGIRQRTWSPAPWVGDGSASTGELVETVREEIADHLRVTMSQPAGQRVVGLTGGKDSRLILSVLLSEGLASRATFRTFGAETLPDVPVARGIADRFGLEHRWGVSRPAAPMPWSEAVRWQVAATSGTLNIWNLASRQVADDDLVVSGLCGEMLRTFYPAMSSARTATELEHRAVTGWRLGARGLLKPEVHAELRGEALASLFDDPLGDASPLDLVDVFYLRHRVRRLWGTAAGLDRTNQVLPLYSLPALQAAFALGGPRRHAEVLHRRVMQLCCPELVDLPFAGSTWPPDPGDGRPGSQLPRRLGRPAAARVLRRSLQPVRRSAVGGVAARAIRRASPAGPDGGSLRQTANQQYHARTLGEKKRVLDEILAGDPSNPVFDVLDRARVLDALSRMGELGLHERVRLFGAATGALWLGGDTGSSPTPGRVPSTAGSAP